MPPAIGDNLWPNHGITPPAAPQKTAPSADAGATPSEAGDPASPLTPSCVTTTTSNCEPPSAAISLIRRLIDIARSRISLLSALETDEQFNSMEAMHQAEMLKHDAEDIMSLLADFRPQPAIRNSQSDDQK